jgi:hypothetical protein
MRTADGGVHLRVDVLPDGRAAVTGLFIHGPDISAATLRDIPFLKLASTSARNVGPNRRMVEKSSRAPDNPDPTISDWNAALPGLAGSLRGA